MSVYLLIVKMEMRASIRLSIRHTRNREYSERMRSVVKNKALLIKNNLIGR